MSHPLTYEVIAPPTRAPLPYSDRPSRPKPSLSRGDGRCPSSTRLSSQLTPISCVTRAGRTRPSSIIGRDLSQSAAANLGSDLRQPALETSQSWPAASSGRSTLDRWERKPGAQPRTRTWTRGRGARRSRVSRWPRAYMSVASEVAMNLGPINSRAGALPSRPQRCSRRCTTIRRRVGHSRSR
jgi:hypothetical protein